MPRLERQSRNGHRHGDDHRVFGRRDVPAAPFDLDSAGRDVVGALAAGQYIGTTDNTVLDDIGDATYSIWINTVGTTGGILGKWASWNRCDDLSVWRIASLLR